MTDNNAGFVNHDLPSGDDSVAVAAELWEKKTPKPPINFHFARPLQIRLLKKPQTRIPMALLKVPVRSRMRAGNKPPVRNPSVERLTRPL